MHRSLPQRVFAQRAARFFQREGDAVAPLGKHAILRAEPGADTPFPSSNPNAAYVLADEIPDLAAIRDFYHARSIPRFFLWVTPGAALQETHRRALALGFAPFPYVQYPTLARLPTTQGSPHARVRCVTAADAQCPPEAWDSLWDSAAASARFLRMLGKTGHPLFAAFESGKPIAAAALHASEGLGYLGFAVVHPEHRRQGLHRELIAARLAAAADSGCDTCVAETVTVLDRSLNNLKQAGFVEAFSQQVYQWREPG